MHTRNNQSGQVAIVILLIMVVLLTLGLSLASRTTQEVFLSQQEADSARVFNAAETGIENALSQNFDGIPATSVPTVVENITTTTTITPHPVLETQIVEGSTAHLDLSGVSGGTQITIEWSKQLGCDNSASLVVTTYYDDGGTTKAVHDAFGPALPCTSPRDSDGFFQESTSGLNGYTYSHTINVPAVPIFMRIKAIYNDASIRVSGAGGSQSFIIRSAANNDSGSEGRTIEVTRGLSTAPSFMDYAVYSGGTLQQ